MEHFVKKLEATRDRGMQHILVTQSILTLSNAKIFRLSVSFLGDPVRHNLIFQLALSVFQWCTTQIAMAWIIRATPTGVTLKPRSQSTIIEMLILACEFLASCSNNLTLILFSAAFTCPYGTDAIFDLGGTDQNAGSQVVSTLCDEFAATPGQWRIDIGGDVITKFTCKNW